MREINKILVTGSSGTIGTRLCERLIGEGYEVICVDKKLNKWDKSINSKTILCNLINENELEKLPKDIDLIIHLAANARVYNLVVEPYLARDNFEMLFNILEFTRKSNIKRFIFASSREVYGNSEKLIHNEDESSIKNSDSPYTASKIGGESLVYSYNKCYGINFCILRFSNVYGMYDDSNRIVPSFIRSCKNEKDLVVFGKDKILDFTYIDDTVEGILKNIERFDKTKNEVFNISSGKGTSVIKVAELIKDITKSKSEIVLKESRTGEVVKYVADITKARNFFGYYPKVDIEMGIKKSIEDFNKYG